MTTAAAAEQKVHGILSSKINERAVDAALKELRIDVPKRADLTKRVGLLKQFFETQEAADLSNCDECLADSLTRLASCPFCGQGEAVSAVNGTALATTNGAAMVLKAAPELDKYVEEIRAIQQQTGRVGWQLCQAIADGARSNVWKSRQTADGKVAYKTYEQFAAAELGMSKKYVQSLIRIHERFSKEMIEQAGTAKLRLLIAAPPEKQGEVLEKIKKGASKREVSRAARDEKKETKAKGVAPSEKRTTITVAAVEGKKTIKCYCKPVSREAFDVKTARPAKKLADAPWGWLDLTNDVRLTFTVLQNAAGEIIIRTHIQRVE